MKEYILSVVCLIGIISFFSGCSTDPNEKANELYVEASQLMQSAKTVESYSEAFEIYNSALKNIQRIMSKYSTSTLAVQLVSGETKIEGLALSEFQKLEGHLKRLAEAEQNLLSCALFIAKTIENANFKAWALAEIAGKYAEVGQKEKAAQIVSQALETAKTIEDASYKAVALAEIAGKYAEVGEQPNKEYIANLRDIVHSTNPMKYLWE